MNRSYNYTTAASTKLNAATNDAAPNATPNAMPRVLNDAKLSHDMKLINDVYVRILKMGKKLYLGSDADPTIKMAQNLESYVGYLNGLNEKITKILDLTTQFADQCLEKATDIREQVNIENKYEGDPSRLFMAYGNRYKNMSWADLDEMEETTQTVLGDVESVVETRVTKKDYAYMPVLYKTIPSIYGANLGFNFKVPIVDRINDMPSALYWYRGDAKHAPGVYICLSRGFYVQVPFPNVADSTKDFNRTGSIKCKYNTIGECHKIRSDLARKYKSDVRPCNFAHTGDRYVKIGTSFRCASNPRFGNHTHLSSDMDTVTSEDINTILMYSLSDILLSSIWAQRHKRNDIRTNIDIC